MPESRPLKALMPKITPFLWFQDNAEDAMNFYVSVFKNSKIIGMDRMGESGSVTIGTFEIEGQEFYALNGGPHYSFTPAISLFVSCETQDEVDELWEKLSEGGKSLQCGWVTDKFGVTWQIIPSVLGELMGDPDPEKSKRVYEAMLQMTKIDAAALRKAYEG